MFAGIKRWQVIAIGGAVLGISVAEAAVLLKIGCDIGFAASQIKFSSFSYAFVIVLMLDGTADRVMKERRWAGLLASVGDCAYGIFYIHVLVLQIAQKVIRMINLPQIWILNFVACFLLTACGSYLIIQVMRKIAEKAGAEKLLKMIGF